MTVTILTTEEIAKPSNRRLQSSAVELIERHGVDPADCLGLRYEDAGEYLPGTLTFVMYDRRDGARYADEEGNPATFTTVVDLIGELPGWWDTVAKVQV